MVKCGIKQMARADEPTASPEKVKPKPCERDRLGGARLDLAKNATNIGAAAPEAGKRSVGYGAVRGIYDDAKRGERQPWRTARYFRSLASRSDAEAGTAS
jgi:hypothetical protein